MIKTNRVLKQGLCLVIAMLMFLYVVTSCAPPSEAYNDYSAPTNVLPTTDGVFLAGGTYVERFVDPKYDVVCYVSRTGGLFCLDYTN